MNALLYGRSKEDKKPTWSGSPAELRELLAMEELAWTEWKQHLVKL